MKPYLIISMRLLLKPIDIQYLQNTAQSLKKFPQNSSTVTIFQLQRQNPTKIRDLKQLDHDTLRDHGI